MTVLEPVAAEINVDLFCSDEKSDIIEQEEMDLISKLLRLKFPVSAKMEAIYIDSTDFYDSMDVDSDSDIEEQHFQSQKYSEVSMR